MNRSLHKALWGLRRQTNKQTKPKTTGKKREADWRQIRKWCLWGKG